MSSGRDPEVIFSDDDLLVVDKPPGLLSIPDGHDPHKLHLKTVLEPRYGRLWTVHRLDKATSGLILLARNAEAHRHLNAQFSNRQVVKIYRAIVVGVPLWDQIVVDKPLRSNVGRRKRTIVDARYGKPARTDFQLLRRYRHHALVEARPHTGRRHQIRAHLYALGLPILADPLYGDGASSTLIGRLALHARLLTCIHPTTAKRIDFEAPEGKDFLTTLADLGDSAGWRDSSFLGKL